MTTLKIQQGWHPEKSGYDVTTSPEMIAQTLATLKLKRMFLVLIHKRYQSTGTILVDYSKNYLQIDKPVDWPGTETVIRVVFKDAAKLWNHFTVKVLGVKDDLLHTSRPSKLYRLQRRAHFRVETPRDSTASFSYQGTTYSDLELIDISAGGMQACSKKQLPLSGDNITVNNITLYVPPTTDIAETNLEILKGEVVRIHRNEEQHSSCYGITFEYSQNEEELLLKYVRQRELEMLRSGLLSQ
ncbi:MAG: PilZ domain-containing protein [Desulfobulbaceae bacterium]|nr:PilZ domain-containing protein [Desulfobulbaceae bacterium]